MSAIALATIDPDQLRPIVSHTEDTVLDFIRYRARQLEADFGVRIHYDHDGSRGRAVDRGNLELYGAYDPEQTHASTIFGIVAELDGQPVGLLQSAVYSLGAYDLAQYTARFGLYRGSPRIEFREPAIFLAAGIRGQAAFNGNLWVSRDMRNTPFSKAWPTVSGQILRSVALATLDVQHTWLFMRARIAAKVTSTAEHRCGGVWWNGEERWIAYSGARFIRDTIGEDALGGRLSEADSAASVMLPDVPVPASKR